MAIISKSEMFYLDYSWNAIPGDDPRISGQPDSTLLSRKEGYEVLYFINKFVDRQNSWRDLPAEEKKNLARKVEKMVRLTPSDLRSQTNVENWIIKNWVSHPNL